MEIEQNSQLSNELIRMAERDQVMRMKHLTMNEWDSSIDEQNTERLKAIVEELGWPTVSRVGREAVFAAWLLIQHADFDPNFQERCLELIHQLPEAEIEASNLAYFEDRVRLNTGQLQLYGTQFMMKTGAFGPQPIEDRVHLDQRRAKIGLNSFDDYTLEMMKIYEQHQSTIDKRNGI